MTMRAADEQTEVLLTEYVEGRLGPEKRAEVDAYLASHPKERGVIEELMSQRQVLASMGGEHAPDDVYEAVREQLERASLLDDFGSERGGGSRLSIRRFMAPRMLAAAALLVLTTGLGGIVFLVLFPKEQSRYAFSRDRALSSPAVVAAPDNVAPGDLAGSSVARGAPGETPQQQLLQEQLGSQRAIAPEAAERRELADRAVRGGGLAGAAPRAANDFAARSGDTKLKEARSPDDNTSVARPRTAPTAHAQADADHASKQVTGGSARQAAPVPQASALLPASTPPPAPAAIEGRSSRDADGSRSEAGRQAASSAKAEGTGLGTPSLDYGARSPAGRSPESASDKAARATLGVATPRAERLVLTTDDSVAARVQVEDVLKAGGWTYRALPAGTSGQAAQRIAGEMQLSADKLRSALEGGQVLPEAILRGAAASNAQLPNEGAGNTGPTGGIAGDVGRNEQPPASQAPASRSSLPDTQSNDANTQPGSSQGDLAARASQLQNRQAREARNRAMQNSGLRNYGDRDLQADQEPTLLVVQVEPDQAGALTRALAALGQVHEVDAGQVPVAALPKLEKSGRSIDADAFRPLAPATSPAGAGREQVGLHPQGTPVGVRYVLVEIVTRTNSPRPSAATRPAMPDDGK